MNLSLFSPCLFLSHLLPSNCSDKTIGSAQSFPVFQAEHVPLLLAACLVAGAVPELDAIDSPSSLVLRKKIDMQAAAMPACHV